MSIQHPFDVRALREEQLPVLTAELRSELVESVTQSGGHFASSLGVAELTVTLHYLFDTPHDKVVWDVGHQAYIHKMLTGRRAQLHSIRQRGGISGFLKRSESEFDCFDAGHAGTSLSAALGMRLAMDRRCAQRFVVAVIGDGALTAGMALEALNHIGALLPKRLILVLNDNQMSISENVGALHRLCGQSNPETPASASFFASLGIPTIGPIDGHSFAELLPAFRRAKAADGPVVIHVKTQKGRGHSAAERDPIAWHGIAAPASKPGGTPTYTAVFAETLIDLAKRDSRIVAITAAMPTGTGLDRFRAELHMPSSMLESPSNTQ